MMKKRLLGLAITALIRMIGLTLRIRLDDRAGVSSQPPEGAMIWAFWHNRVFTAPLVRQKFLGSRSGGVLTSPSGDGEIIAQVMARFGVGSIRGSSNKRPVAALRELVAWIGRGQDIAVTPDGPRGPMHELQPGVIKLAQLSGVPILPIRIRYSRALTLKTWDRFQVPLPFSRVDVVFDDLRAVPRRLDEAGFEKERSELEQILKREP